MAEPDGARDAILARVRAALADRPRPPTVARDYIREPDSDVDVVDLFAERAGDYRATVEVLAQPEVAAAIGRTLRSRGARRVVVPPGFPEQWIDGVSASGEPEFEWLRDDPPLSVAELDAADGVVTGAALAIALTGTIVLDAGPGQGRRALSLLPDLHVCVVEADQIAANVPAAIERLVPSRPQTWISGPSATSDIELNRVEGVHGPRNLHIIVAR